MTIQSYSALRADIAAKINDNTAGDITPAEVRGILNDFTDVIPFYQYCFVADNTGATDVTAQLDALLASAAGAVVYIPPGRYKINDLNCNYSVNIWAQRGTVEFIYDIEKQCFNAGTNMQSWMRNNAVQRTVNSITRGIAVDGFTFTTDMDEVSILVLDSVAGLKEGDKLQVFSNDFEPWGNSRYGEVIPILKVDANTNTVYCQGQLEYHDYYLTTIKANKVLEDRFFRIRGVSFTAPLGDDWLRDACVRNGNGGWAINLWGYHRVEVTGCDFYKLWTGAVTTRFCQDVIFQNNYVHHVANYKTAAPDVLLPNNPIATIAGQAYIYVNHPAHGFTNVTKPHFTLTKASGVAAIGGIPSAEIYDKGVDIDVIGPDAYRFATTTVATSTVGTVSGTSPNQTVTGGAGGSNVNQDWISGRLGYGINIYGASYRAVILNNIFENCRHVNTTGGYESTETFNPAYHYLYGCPTQMLVKGNISYAAWGVPFDTHEQGSGFIFEDNVVIFPSRGPHGGSYAAYGFQNRARNVTVRGYTQYGGNYGLRWAAVRHKNSKNVMDNIVLRKLNRPDSNIGYGINIDNVAAFSADQRPSYVIGSVLCVDVESPMIVSAGNSVKLGSLIARNYTGPGIDLQADVVFQAGNIDLSNDTGIFGTQGIKTVASSTTTIEVDKFVCRGLGTGSSNNEGFFMASGVIAKFGHFEVDTCFYGLETSNGAGLFSADKFIVRGAADKGAYAASNLDIADIWIDGEGVTADGIQTQTGCTQLNIRKGRIFGFTNCGLQLSNSMGLAIDDLKIVGPNAAGSYGIYSGSSNTIVGDRLIIDKCETGVRAEASSTFDVDYVKVAGSTAVGLKGVTGAVFEIAQFVGRDNVNDNLEGDGNVVFNIGYAYYNDGKSLIDAQKNTQAAFGFVRADLKNSAAAANLNVALMRADATLGASDVSIDVLSIRRDDVSGTPQYVFSEQDTGVTTPRKVFVGTIIEDNWNNVTPLMPFSDTATLFTWNDRKTNRRYGSGVAKTITATTALTSADLARDINCNAAGAITVTLPKEAIPGTEIMFFQEGAGQVTLAVEAGGTLVNRQNHTKTAGQNAIVRAWVKSNSNLQSATWVLSGDTAA